MTNPFSFGALALDDSFADRESELAELTSDIRNGQDVVSSRLAAAASPRWSGAQPMRLPAEQVLVAQVDLMTTPTKESLAAALAKSIYEQIASPLERVRERALAPFRGLRMQPVINVNPEDGNFSFSFAIAQRPAEIDATLERLFELPAELSSVRGRRVALVMDEFQEIVDIDPACQSSALGFPAPAGGCPRLLRQQAPHHGAHLQRRQRAVLAQRQVNGAGDDPGRAVRGVHCRAF